MHRPLRGFGQLILSANGRHWAWD